MTKRFLGTCYYPEHWPREQWADDARRMTELGLTWIRIGEFAWSRIEPNFGEFDFEWLDTAIETLGAAGLKVVLGTPTATPPRWMVDRHPDMLSIDENGDVRKFGSRRHYCFSHQGYRKESVRITAKLAERYGQNPHVAAWQTDNEFGCHDTTLSYSLAAQGQFRRWLENRYESPQALNEAWGNVFWSMEYDTFDQVELPNQTVTKSNPAHRMAFRRFSSDQVVSYNKLQVDEIKKHTDAPIAHNYMGRITEFDHFKVGDDLEISSWDSYPLGFLEDRIEETEEFKHAHSRQGHPDFQAFHHDIYRAVGNGRWWVMEQQPGPVNWAPYNPAPLPGMVRLWSWEALAHGAESVLYFRWRQAPFAQEQMHSGLLRPDSENAPAHHEALQVAKELQEIGDDDAVRADVGIVFDYESDWVTDILPQGDTNKYFDLVFDYYRAARKFGLSIDIVKPNATDLSDYKVVMLPGVATLSDELRAAIDKFDGVTIAGPQTNSKTNEFSIPVPLPPNLPGLDATIECVESLRPSEQPKVNGGGHVQRWLETLDTNANVAGELENGKAVVVRQSNMIYVAGWLDQVGLANLFKQVCTETDIAIEEMPASVRRRDTDGYKFYFNYGPTAQTISGHQVEPAGVHWEKR